MLGAREGKAFSRSHGFFCCYSCPSFGTVGLAADAVSISYKDFEFLCKSLGFIWNLMEKQFKSLGALKTSLEYISQNKVKSCVYPDMFSALAFRSENLPKRKVSGRWGDRFV